MTESYTLSDFDIDNFMKEKGSDVVTEFKDEGEVDIVGDNYHVSADVIDRPVRAASHYKRYVSYNDNYQLSVVQDSQAN